MRRLLKLLTHPFVIRVLVVVLVAWLTWWLAPMVITLRGRERFWMAVIVASVVALMLLVMWLKSLLDARRMDRGLRNQVEEPGKEAGPDIQPEIEALRVEFDRACDELSADQSWWAPWRRASLYTLPWVVVFGPPAAGKTTALRRSGLRFTSLGRGIAGVGGTRNCTWWLSQEAVFLDTAGRYAVQEEDHAEWEGFLGLLRKYRPGRPIDGAVVQVGIDSLVLMDMSMIEDMADQLRQRMDELILHLHVRYPVSVVFSKCDRLDGFREYFAHLGKDDREKAWGFSLDIDDTGPDGLEAAFSERFRDLVDRLVETVQPRLERLPQTPARVRAAMFPDELASHEERIRYFLKILFERKRSRDIPWLRSVFFGSAREEGAAMPGVRQRVLQEASMPPDDGATGVPVDESRFLTGMFARIVDQAKHPLRLSAHGRRLRWTWLGSATIIACVLAFFGSCAIARHHERQLAWLEQVDTITQFLTSDAEATTRGVGDPIKLSNILEKQNQLQALLHTGGDGDVAAIAQTLLLESTAELWVLPKRPVDPDHPGRLELPLEYQVQLARACVRSDEGASQNCSKAFNALRANVILEGKACGRVEVRNGAAAAWLARHLASVWAEDPLVTQAAFHPYDIRTLQQLLEVRLQDYFRTEFSQGYGVSHRRLVLDQTLVQEARVLLRKAEKGGLYVSLLSDQLELYPRKRLIDSRVADDPGIAKLYLREGCEAMVGADTDAREWLLCVLQIDENELEEDIIWQDVYLSQFERAWNDWLGETVANINWKIEVPSTVRGSAQEPGGASRPLSNVTDLLEQVAGSSTAIMNQLFRKIGDEPTCPDTKSQEDGASIKRYYRLLRQGARGMARTVASGGLPPSLSDEVVFCDAAQSPFCPFAATARGEKDSAMAEAFADFVDELRNLQTYLEQKINGVPKPQINALELVRQVIRGDLDCPLVRYRTARDALFRVMRERETWQAMSDKGVDHLRDNVDSLAAALRRLEGFLWDTLLNLAAQGLQDAWNGQVWGEWETRVRYRGPRDPRGVVGACEDEASFITKELAAFRKEQLDPFYADVYRCVLQKDTYGQTLAILPGACKRINEALARVPRCSVDEPAAPPPKLSLDRFTCRGFRASVVHVELDDGRNVFRFSTITGRARKVDGVAPSNHPGVSLSFTSGDTFSIPLPLTMDALAREVRRNQVSARPGIRGARIVGTQIRLILESMIKGTFIGPEPTVILEFPTDVNPPPSGPVRTEADVAADVRSIRLPKFIIATSLRSR